MITNRSLNLYGVGMSFFGMLFSGLGSIISAAVDIVSEVVSTVTSIFSSKKIEPKTVYQERDRKQDQIHDLNEEILRLRSRYLDVGYLNDAEKRRHKVLDERRQELKSDIDEQRQVIAADTFVQNEALINKVEIDLETTHVLQWNAFADTLGKTCPKCARVMKLQWRRNLDQVRPDDFYWGCTGWYFINNKDLRMCNYTEDMKKQDYSLLTDTSAPEFSLTSDEFTTIIQDEDTSKLIIERMDDLQSDLKSRSEGINIVCCPIHAEPMVLQKKKNGVGLLDQYYLRCKHWKPDNKGCTYIEKLKSGSQLAALLKNKTGNGLL